MNVNTQIYDKTVDRTAMLRLHENEGAEKIHKVFDVHEAEVLKIVKRNKPKLTKELQQELADEITSTYSQLHGNTSRGLIALVNDQVAFGAANLKHAVGKVWRVETPGRRVSEEIVLKRPIYNEVTLSSAWKTSALNEKKRIEQILRAGIAEGEDEFALASRLMKGNAFKLSRSNALGIARTAMTSVYAQADHEVYKANAKALQGYQYIAVLDSRTTSVCASRDGKIYPIGDLTHLPPAHWYCRSTTTPVVKHYNDLMRLEAVGQVRRRNLASLTPKEIAAYDGVTPLGESYQLWLTRQPLDVQLRHFGDTQKLELFRTGQLTVDRFVDEKGRKLSLRDLRTLTDSGYALPGDTMRFATAKEKLDTLQLGITTPEDLLGDKLLQRNLKEYFLLQAGELDGTLSLTNFRGTLVHTKKSTKARVLSTPPTEAQLKYNPLTNQYEDTRRYQPAPNVLANTHRLVEAAEDLKVEDKKFILEFSDSLDGSMSVNERAVVTENLRIIFTRFRKNGEPWNNFKAVSNSQLKFDMMNVSDAIETQLRKDSNVLHKLAIDQYIDPVLGPVQLKELGDNLVSNIHAKNLWEDRTAVSIGRELRGLVDTKIPMRISQRLTDSQKRDFYTRFAMRLGLGDTPDRDQLAIVLGRDLFNAANWKGSRNEWYNLGVKLLDDADNKGFYSLETYGVQKRRMKSRNGGRYFGPYYDTFSVNLRVTHPKLREYSTLIRKVDVGLRVPVIDGKNKLHVREGYKTYFDKWNRDTRVPITSTHSFSDFPVELVDKDMTNALNWASESQFKIDGDFHDFIKKLIYFEDDKGRARYFNDLNQYREFMVGRGDAYERFKAMEWLRKEDKPFSNNIFLDHRARIYDRGLISPQSGESFRPFLSTAEAKSLTVTDYKCLQDQIGGFLGGLSDKLEGANNSLSFIGRQKIAEKWRKELIGIGDAMLRGKPNDIRFILESDFMAMIDGEEQGKALRFAMEMSKINKHLAGDFSSKSIAANIGRYKTALALEQDASSSGAQIIALTTKNKQLATLSNVVMTNQKQRLYDEIAYSTYHDPRFIELNRRFGLTEKDLRKAAKAYYGSSKIGLIAGISL